MKYFLAIDLGASSGRHIVGYIENGEMIYDEVYRFPNSVKYYNGHYIWDIDYILEEVKKGIRKAVSKYHKLESLSVDSWGCDYVLVRGDKTIYPCYAYRDNRTNEAINEVHKIISFKDLYKITGTQFQKFNTIYQLYADKMAGRLDEKTEALMIPEYIIYRLTGRKVREYTNLGTTGLFDINKKVISEEITSKLGINFSKDVLTPGTYIGKTIAERTKVVLCSTHDTASAIEGLDIENNELYISSGTWSLIGIKTNDPCTNEESLKANYSNELGPDYIRYQKNIMGLWIVNKLSEEMGYDMDQMIKKAKLGRYYDVFDVNDERFLSPKSMIAEILGWYKDHKIKIPRNERKLCKCVFNSLVYSYKNAVDQLESITSLKFNKVYIVGGGSKNNYLNECLREALNIETILCDIESAAYGNIKDQMKFTGEVDEDI